MVHHSRSAFFSTARIKVASHGILRGRLRPILETVPSPSSSCRPAAETCRTCFECNCRTCCRTVAMAEATKVRGSNFSSVELNLLVVSWLHVSQDPIVGSGQKLGAFWDRTMKHYNDHVPADREKRNVRSLETKWSDVKRDVAKFAGCYQNIVDQHISGLSLDEILLRAKQLYVVKDSKGKEFAYVDQWYLLKDYPRFAMSIDDMKQKVAQKKARKQKGKGRNVNHDKENVPPNVDGIFTDLGDDEAPPDDAPLADTDESLHFGEQRPLGNKHAKKLRSDESAMKVMAAAQRDMVAIASKRLKLAEKLADKQDRDSLLFLRVDDLDEECRAYFRVCRAKELQIAMTKLQREEEEETRRLIRGTTRTPLPVVPFANTAMNSDEGSPTRLEVSQSVAEVAADENPGSNWLTDPL